MATARRIDPLFVYALVGAESNFDPQAANGDARGLLQLKPPAWRSNSAIPYEPAVWDAQANLAVGLDRLARAKAGLEARRVFSYRLLWAAHHYDFASVAAADFEIERFPKPSDPISFALWAGQTHPLEPPK